MAGCSGFLVLVYDPLVRNWSAWYFDSAPSSQGCRVSFVLVFCGDCVNGNIVVARTSKCDCLTYEDLSTSITLLPDENSLDERDVAVRRWAWVGPSETVSG